MKRHDIVRIVNELATKIIGIDGIEITPQSTLKDDLYLDSIDIVELVINIEKEFNIYIDDDKISFTNMKGVYDEVESLVNID